MVSLQVDGMVIGSGRLSNKAILEVAKQTKTVVLGREVPGVDTVDHDERRTTAELLGHLVELGHRSVGFLAPPTQYNRGAVTKTKSLREEAGRVGIDLIFQDASYELTPCQEATAHLITAHPEVMAVLGLSSLAGLGAMAALQSAGLRVPEDVSVACFNDPMFADIPQLGLTGVRPSQGHSRRALRPPQCGGCGDVLQSFRDRYSGKR